MLTLKEAKKHIIVDEDFHDDDELIQMYIDTAYQAVLMDANLTDDEAHQGEGESRKLRPTIKQAMLMLIEHFYNNRGSEAPVQLHSVGHGYDYLVMLNKCYSTADKQHTTH